MSAWSVVGCWLLFLLMICAFARASAPLGKRW